ncbi:MAG: alpha/beta fold hydrolase [Mycobacterium sp.]|nr:alpha/beta fold hydrolase [Mycobacterium sp.]
MRRVVVLLVSFIVLLPVCMMASACAPKSPTPPPGAQPEAKAFQPQFDGAPAIPAPDLTDDGPGSLVSAKEFRGSDYLDDINASYVRMMYRSTSGIDGSPTEVSGIVVVPAGDPPNGGWPILAFGHGTTGVLNKCAPSRFNQLPGTAYMIQAMVMNGFAVAMTDYQGIGVPNYYHPFLDAKTFGYNMIDAVRAARKVDPNLSKEWVAFGHSLGGLAAWAAADLNDTYGQGMDLRGTLSMAPAADMSGLADAAWNETLTQDQRVALVFVLQSLKWIHPDLDLEAYRRGATAEHWDELLNCLPPDLNDVSRVRRLMKNSDLKPATEEDRDRLREYLAQMSLPLHKITSPMAVVYGTEDTLVDVEWTEQALKRACAMGSHILIEKKMGQGHGDLDSAFGLPWLISRLTDETVPNSCLDGDWS